MSANSPSSPRQSQPSQGHWRGNAYTLATAAIVVVGGVLGAGWNYLTSAPAPASARPVVESVTKSSDAPGESDPVSTADAKYRQLIVGRWETDRDGRRVMTVSDNGTAVMNVEVTGTWSYVLGSEITLNLNWQIEDGVLKFQTTGGKPESSINVLTNLYGSERNQPIIRLDETTLRVPDDEPEDDDHVWTRLSATSPGK